MNSKSTLAILVVVTASLLPYSWGFNQDSSETQTFEHPSSAKESQSSFSYESNESKSSYSSNQISTKNQYGPSSSLGGSTEDGFDPEFDPTEEDTITAETPTKTIFCPGPINTGTGEGVWIDGHCEIMCFNNLVLDGDRCTCPPTYHFDHKNVKCVCRPPLCEQGGKCILKPSQYPGVHNSAHRKRSMPAQLRLTPQVYNGNHARTSFDDKHCISNEIACRIGSMTGGVQCVDPTSDLEHCGGCSNTTEGINCNQIPGVENAGCNQSKCVIFSCKDGHRLVNNVCVKALNNKRRL
ncbi:hypothetical protein BY996DRAFT_4573062 [Phakopsora pachyrhizi]|uniref:Expressed protein n=1 Tax=Phakopsora pachyrhizi TaxID=170000 RepID=A0AAV0AIW1_PHAPC|nr:hypothetical protein BY996DRAFT_4573062 [Phakopsora pachyrhizi]CAH7668177.1 expressed protein [Phakopsora pachyrhizi]